MGKKKYFQEGEDSKLPPLVNYFLFSLHPLAFLAAK
jgi:hypothetical protein